MQHNSLSAKATIHHNIATIGVLSNRQSTTLISRITEHSAAWHNSHDLTQNYALPSHKTKMKGKLSFLSLRNISIHKEVLVRRIYWGHFLRSTIINKQNYETEHIYKVHFFDKCNSMKCIVWRQSPGIITKHVDVAYVEFYKHLWIITTKQDYHCTKI